MRAAGRLSSLLVRVFALLLAVDSVRAVTPEEAAGVPWGASPVAVKLAMASKPGVTLDEDVPDHLTYKGGNLAGMPVKEWRIVFVNTTMSRLNVIFVLPEGGDAKGSFADRTRANLHRQLEQKYGRHKNEAGNDWYHTWVWEWPSMAVKGASKSIQLMDAWHDGHLELYYRDNLPPVGASATPAYFGQPGGKNDL